MVEKVQFGHPQEVDPLVTASPAAVADETAETWKTRPESIGVFLGNLLVCALFPIFALWFGPKYVMRREYVRALLCVVVPLVLLSVFVFAA